MGKGGGDVNIPQRNAGHEFQSIKKFFPAAEGMYEQGLPKKDPLLSLLYPGAADYFNSPTSPLLSEMQSQGLSQLQAGQSPLLQDLNKRGMTQDPLLQQLNQRAMSMGPDALLKSLNTTVNTPDFLSGKVSSQELANVVDTPTLAKFAALGNAGGNQAAIQNFLNRDQYVNARQQTHLGEAGNVEGLNQSQLDLQNRFGLGVEGANQAFNQFGQGVQQLNTADQQSRFGIAQGVQQASNQDIAQRFSIPQSVFQTGIAGHTALTNPILGWLSDLFSSNQNAAAAQSVAGANQSAGQKSGATSVIGSVIGAVGLAL